MARLALLAASVLSLVLVGPMEKAHADSEAPDSQRVVHLFGATLCFGEVTADVSCDWRIPAPASRAHRPDAAFTLFGVRFCRGGHDATHCDVRLPAAPNPGVAARAEPAEPSRVFRILGMNVCVGAASPASSCDVKLPGSAAEHGDRRASL